MVIEESSVVAAAGNAAKFWQTRGGFKAEVLDTIKVGQIHFSYSGDVQLLHSFFNKNKEEKTKNEDISYIQKYLTNIDDKFFDINNYIVKEEKCKCSGELISVEH